MTDDESPKYPLERRELIAESHGLRVRVLTIGPGQRVPWHRHTAISDTFFCLEGPMVVESRGPDERHLLGVGDSLCVPAGRPHTVFGLDSARCRFVIVQGVGEYDYIPVD